MKHYAKGLALISLLLLVSSGLLVLVQPVTPVKSQATFKNVSLPSGNVPVAILYQDGFIWVGGYWTGCLYKIDVASEMIVESWYVTGSENHDIGLYGICFDGEDLWLTARQSGELYKFDLAGEVFELKATGLGDATNIICLDGYVYADHNDGITKVEVSSGTVTEIPLPEGHYYGIVAFGSNILVSSLVAGDILEVNSTDGSFITRVSGLHRPLGLALNENTLYIAENVRWEGEGYENGWTPAVVTVNTETWTISRRNVAGSPYSVAVVKSGPSSYVAWSSSGEDESNTRAIGLLSPSTSFAVSYGAVYYLATDGATIFFSYYGSAGVGGLDNWQPSPEVSTKLTLNDLGSVPPNTTIMVTGSLRGQYLELSGGVKNKTVYVTSDWGLDKNATTDVNGFFSVAFKTPEAIGNYTVFASFNGDVHFQPAEANMTIQTIRKATTLSLTTKLSYGVYTVSGYLRDLNGIGLSGRNLEVRVWRVYYGRLILKYSATIKTALNGFYKFTFNRGDSYHFKVEVSYKGEAFYQPVTATKTW